MPILETLQNIINNKYNEVHRQDAENLIFNKIYKLEGNAVGQIGEKFVRTIFQENNISILDNRTTIHDEYDILTINNIKIEIKTARLGKNNTFQFNGIEPIRNYSYIFLIGISGESLYWRILKWDECYRYEHSRRSGYCRCIEII